jgi:tRNA (guanine37-N1)-methyltransferase
MRLDILTIFPEYLDPLNVSLVGKARARGRLDVRVHDLRHWTHDRHHTVDDTPYGGGPGMVMKTEPWGEALDDVIADGYESGARQPVLVVPTPSGRPFTQECAHTLSEQPWLIFTPARYEGIDRRVMDEYATRLPVHEVSIGDYVLAGGEAPVLVIVEAVARLLPGVLGNAASHHDDSFAPGAMAGLLEGPVYTKPPEWRGRDIPDVLLSGHHGRIARWRRDEALRRTTDHRPDLIQHGDPAAFDRKDREMLAVLGWQPGPDGRYVRAADFADADADAGAAAGQGPADGAAGAGAAPGGSGIRQDAPGG